MSQEPSVQQPANPNNLDNIIEDEKTLAIKEKVMARQKNSSLLNSLSKVTMFVGTMFTTAGTTMALGALTGAAAVAASPAIIVGVLAAGLAFLATALTTDYASSRIYQGCNFDNLEANADSTARHLVKEMRANNICVQEHIEHDRQGKDWVKHVGGPRALDASMTKRLNAQRTADALAQEARSVA